MNAMGMGKTALLASYEKDNALLRLATLLTKHGWELWASQGTARYLREHGILSKDVADVVGEPILGHRVVTLSREIHAGLLAETDDDFEELRRLHIQPIDLVYVTLYPLEKTISDPHSSEQDIILRTDIGGPTILRAAAKARRLTLSNADQIDALEKWLNDGSTDSERASLARKLAAAAERRVADYVDVSARYWESKV